MKLGLSGSEVLIKRDVSDAKVISPEERSVLYVEWHSVTSVHLKDLWEILTHFHTDTVHPQVLFKV